MKRTHRQYYYCYQPLLFESQIIIEKLLNVQYMFFYTLNSILENDGEAGEAQLEIQVFLL